MKKKIIAVIPARYSSSRFPGKPLADIHGKPMIWWAYCQAKKVNELSEVYVATDDERIKTACEQYDMPVIVTSSSHRTGSDRVAEVAEKIVADVYVVLFADEPLIKKDDLQNLIDATIQSKADAGMLTTKFKNPVDVVNTTTVKLVLNDQNEVIFMTRSPVPFPKASLDVAYYKHIGAYTYTKNALEVFRKFKPGRLEKIEDVETLRLLEKHLIVMAYEVDSDSMSVDTPKDLERIRNIIGSSMRKEAHEK